jgi:23S rRNA pseudouridine2457 synthase
LAEFIPIPQVYAAGRLDADSEGLLLLTNNGRLQQRLTDPRFGHWRRYWVQVEGEAAAHPEALERLRSGLLIQGQLTLPARAQAISDPSLPERTPPIRQRAAIPTSWLQLELQEGRNRQVRRMTAAVNLPTLRLLRVAIDLMDGAAPLELNGLAPGQWREVDEAESQRLERLLKQSRAMGKMSPRLSPRPVSSGPVSSGRGGRAGGGKSGRGAGGG